MLRLAILARQIAVARPLVSRLFTPQQTLDPTPSLLQRFGSPQLTCRCLLSDKPPQLTAGEKAIVTKLKKYLPGCKHVEVSDISGGCGAMYQINIEAEEFRGKKTIAQHRMVNDILQEEINRMHGLQLTTKAPDH